MTLYTLELSIPFELEYKDEIMSFLKEHPHKEFIGIEERDYICLIINRTKTEDILVWLDKVIEIVDYPTYRDLYQKAEPSLFHLYVPARNIQEQFSIPFSAKHLVLFSCLSVIFDVDYGVLFKHEFLD